MVENLDPEAHARLAEVSRRYFLDDRSKTQIAEEFGLSRFKVARMLDLARHSGVVTISIRHPSVVDPVLSTELRDHLRLAEAVVVRGVGAARDVREQVGAAAADLLQSSVASGEVLGLGWGRTLAAMVQSIRGLPDVSVVQLTGVVGSSMADSPVELVRIAAGVAGSASHAIFAPLLVDDAVTAAALRRQTDIAGALALFDHVTTAVVAMGSWDPPSSQLREAMRPDEREDLLRRGVRAEIAATFIADDGSLIGEDYVERCLAISAGQLRRVPRVMAVAGGAEKALAARAASCSGLITALVTDAELARRVMELPPVPAKRAADQGVRAG